MVKSKDTTEPMVTNISIVMSHVPDVTEYLNFCFRVMHFNIEKKRLNIYAYL